MTELTAATNSEATTRLTELVLDHLAVPRPGRSRHIQELQDTLLPSFMETARYTWMAASPMPLPNDPAYQYLQAVLSQTRPQQIRALNAILEALGVHDLLRDVAESPDVLISTQCRPLLAR